MPYIQGEMKLGLNKEINDLLSQLAVVDDDNVEGVMNYTITSLLKAFKRGEGGTWRYKWINRASGTLQKVSAEFDRRIVAPYEDKCIAKNGDIDIYKEFDDDYNSTK